MCNSLCPSCATFSTFTTLQRSTGALAGQYMVNSVTEGCECVGGLLGGRVESAGGRSNRGFLRLRRMKSVAGSPNHSDISRMGLFSLYKSTSQCSPYILWRSKVLLTKRNRKAIYSPKAPETELPKGNLRLKTNRDKVKDQIWIEQLHPTELYSQHITTIR